MSDKHPTTTVDHVQVLSGLLHRLQDSVDRNHEETQSSIGRLTSELDELKGQVKKQSGTDESILHEVRRLERQQDQHADEIRRLKDSHANAKRHVSETNLEREAQQAAANRFVEQVAKDNSKQTDEIATLTKQIGALVTNAHEQSKALKLIVKLAQSPRIAAYVTIGAFVGGVIAGIIWKVIK